MKEFGKNNFFSGHLDQRIQDRFSGTVFESEYQKLMMVFLLIREKENKQSHEEGMSKFAQSLKVSNQALKKLLSHQCSTEDSQINNFLNQIWNKRFSSTNE